MEIKKQSNILMHLAEEVLEEHSEEFKDILEGKYTIAYLLSNYAKKKGDKSVQGTCSLVSNSYKWTCPYDYTITLYLPNIQTLNREQIKILIWHELKHVGADRDTPYIVHHDLEDFKEIVDLYGCYWDLPTGEGELVEFDEVYDNE